MATTVVRPETGAVIKPGPMVTAPPERTVDDEAMMGFASDTGLYGPFLADQLSAFVAHERMGVSLLRALRSRSNNPVLRSRYSDMEGETLLAVDRWERLITALGGNPQYASPAGRAAEGLDLKMAESLNLSGSTDPMTLEQAGAQIFLVAANQCLLNARLLAALAAEATGPNRDLMTTTAMEQVTTAERHAQWAARAVETMVVQQAKHPLLHKAGQAAEKLVDALRSAFDRL